MFLCLHSTNSTAPLLICVPREPSVCPSAAGWVCRSRDGPLRRLCNVWRIAALPETGRSNRSASTNTDRYLLFVRLVARFIGADGQSAHNAAVLNLISWYIKQCSANKVFTRVSAHDPQARNNFTYDQR